MVKIVHATVLLFLLCLPNEQARRRDLVASRSNETPWSLGMVVVTALHQAHRGGSLIYRGKCVDDAQIYDIYSLEPPVITASLDQALGRIARKYPNIRWIDFGEDAVRVVDSSARLDVLNLRVKEFHLHEVENPNLAVTAIWNIPEVKEFADKNHIDFVLNVSGLVPPEGSNTRISVDLYDVSVAEIMDKISQNYRRTWDPAFRSVWSYHECEWRGKMIVELKVM